MIPMQDKRLPYPTPLISVNCPSLSRHRSKTSYIIFPSSFFFYYRSQFLKQNFYGPVRDLNPGPPAPKAGIIPLDQQAAEGQVILYSF